MRFKYTTVTIHCRVRTFVYPDCRWVVSFWVERKRLPLRLPALPVRVSWSYCWWGLTQWGWLVQPHLPPQTQENQRSLLTHICWWRHIVWSHGSNKLANVLPCGQVKTSGVLLNVNFLKWFPFNLFDNRKESQIVILKNTASSSPAQTKNFVTGNEF